MKIKNSLKINQSQKLAINLQMQESLQILRLSYSEMIEKINEELEKNPLLEPFARKDEKNLYNNKVSESKESNLKSKFVENTIQQKKNFRDHINQQINIDISNNEEKLIAREFLEYIDNNGYIKEEDLIKILKKFQLQNYNITSGLVERTLKKIQLFDPPGIFARNLSECIEIQLREKKLFNSKYHFLVRNLELIAKSDINLLSKKTRIKKNELLKMIKNIRSLNPKPANIFEHDDDYGIIPDIVLKENKNNLKLEINNSQMPKFNFNNSLYKIIKKKKLLNREKNNLINWAKAGKLLLDSIKNREKTLEIVAKEIINHQKNFFKKGIDYFNPLTQKEIAKKTGFHESTISRCTTNKFIETPKGIFELKYFFSRGLNSKDKTKVLSNKLIKNKILRLINKEDNKNIMSDENIVFRLKKNGIIIARRTVSKYRELMNIPSSFKRKKQYSKHF
ncbi:MAG: RNA polymerase sigma-54 factor 1 [Alphaproteobacteria bacterium MarineAlpha6_Bin3]|nr:MAG: RNA polymerase sigma-54 factor 1 [Alphaproteobacteria bacterium MarineAlpha6_Bin3]|tara:strand:+ start:2984 stop:4336 length:1353 start_codon:yes stop_codon:yes gene_type:complete